MSKKIIELTASATLADTDLFEKSNNGSQSQKITGAELRAALLNPSVIGLTADKLPKASATTPFLVDSIIDEDGDSLGVNGTPRISRGLDILGSNPKATTAAAENLFQIGSNDASNPLNLGFGIKTDANSAARYTTITADDAGTTRPILVDGTNPTFGIGSISSSRVFSAEWDQGALQAQFKNYSDTANLGTFLRLGRSRGTKAAQAAVQADDLLFSIVAVGQRDGSNDNGEPVLEVNAGGNWALNDYPTYWSFYTTPVGSSSQQLRMRLSSDGNIGIGQTTFGSGAAKVMAFGNGTIPGTVADAFQMVSADIVAGNAAPHFVTEAGPVIRLYQQAHIADPSAGGTVDAEARTAINAILVALENTRLLATS